MRSYSCLTCLLIVSVAAYGQEASTQPAEAEGAPVALSPAGILGLPAAPLDEPIVTDRPDFTESAETVPFGHVQLEMGYTYTLEKEYNHIAREHTVPEFLLRVGLVEKVELRVGWDGYTYSHSRDVVVRENDDGSRTHVRVSDWEQGGSDMSIGAKFKFVEQDGWVPNLAVITELTVPSGSTNMSSGDVEPGLVLAYSWDLNDRFALSGNTGFFVLRDDTHQFLQTTQSVSLGYAIIGPLSGYIEYFVLAPDAIGEDCAHNANTGLTYLITDNIQLDWRIGMGLNERAPDFFTGVGLSIRF